MEQLTELGCVCSFKSRLDKFWQNQDVIYNFKAQIHGTGSRSKSMCIVKCLYDAGIEALACTRLLRLRLVNLL